MTNPSDCENIFYKFGGRRFILTLMALLIASAFAPYKILTGGEWITAITIILGFYNAANTAQKFREAGSHESK